MTVDANIIGDVLLRRNSFFGRCIWYGYGTVWSKTVLYVLRSNMINFTSTFDRILPFREIGVLGSNPGKSCVFCCFTPIYFVLFLLKDAS